MYLLKYIIIGTHNPTKNPIDNIIKLQPNYRI